MQTDPIARKHYEDRFAACNADLAAGIKDCIATFVLDDGSSCQTLAAECEATMHTQRRAMPATSQLNSNPAKGVASF